MVNPAAPNPGLTVKPIQFSGCKIDPQLRQRLWRTSDRSQGNHPVAIRNDDEIPYVRLSKVFRAPSGKNDVVFLKMSRIELAAWPVSLQRDATFQTVLFEFNTFID